MAVLRALPDDRCATTREVAEAAGLDPKVVANRIQRLRQRGFAEIRRAGCYRRTGLGRAVVDSAAADLQRTKRRPLTQAAPRRPKRRTFFDRAWWVLRTERKATLGELLTVMDFGDRNPNTVGAYLRALWRAGYLEVTAHRAAGATPTSNGHLRWVLTKDTGPLAPVVQRARGRVWDANSKSFVAFERAGSPRAFSEGLRR